MKINFFIARKNLFLFWLFSFAVIFFFFLGQTIMGRYYGIENEAWGWLLPNLLPTLMLMTSSFFATHKGSSLNISLEIDRIYYQLSLFLSVLYIVTILVILVSYSPRAGKILDYYRSKSTILASIQSLVSLSLGFFFVKSSK